MASTVEGDVIFRSGTATFAGGVTLPANSVTDTNFNPTTPLAVTKTRRRFNKTYDQPNGSAATSVQQIIHTAYGATGSVVAARACIRTAAAGAATVTVDIKKNGTSILSGVFTINNTHVAFQLVSGTITSANYVSGDTFEVLTVATAGGGTLPQGLGVDVVFDEDPA